MCIKTSLRLGHIIKGLFLWLLLVTRVTAVAQYDVLALCGDTVYVDGLAHPHGWILDDGGRGNNYSDNCLAIVVVSAQLGDTIKLDGWYDIQLDSSGRAEDLLCLYDGVGREGNLISLCKGTGTVVCRTTSGHVSLCFSSDRTSTSAGYGIEYTVVPNRCSNSVTRFVCTDVTPTSLHLSWDARDSVGPFVLGYGDWDTVVYGNSCDLRGLRSDTTYDFRVVGVSDSGDVGCPKGLRCFLPCFVAKASGIRPLVGSRDSIVVVADSADGYRWSTGETTDSIVIKRPGAYALIAYTNGGCSDTLFFFIDSVKWRMNVNVPRCLCPGDSTRLDVGFEMSDAVQVLRDSATVAVSERTFLPDGIMCGDNGCSYVSTYTFSGFPNTAHIRDSNDILYVKLNMEHSWIGDIYVSLMCPDSHRATIMKYGGYGTSACNGSISSDERGWHDGENAAVSAYFGDAYDFEDAHAPCDSTVLNNRPGTGWTYCWSNATNAGFSYFADDYVYRASNVVRNSLDSTYFASGRNFFHPDESFSNLIGCPMNGTWSIEVIDGWTLDNGYIFGLELALNPSRLVRGSNNPTIMRCTLSGPFQYQLDDTTFVIQAPDTLRFDTLGEYTLSIQDSNGYWFDTVFYIPFRAKRDTVIWDSVAENDLPYRFDNTLLFWEPVSDSVIRHLPRQDSCGCDSVVYLNLAVLLNDTAVYDTAVCDNMLPMEWHGHIFDRDTTFVDASPNLNGTTHYDTIRLKSLKSYHNQIDTTICSYEVYRYADTVYSDSGTHTLYDLETQQGGCDSALSLVLHKFPMQYLDTVVSVCDSFVWWQNDSVYFMTTVDSVMTSVLDAATGCFDTAVLNLTVRHSVTVELSVDTCDSFDWFERHYIATTDMMLHDTLHGANLEGCDSIINLHLSVQASDTIPNWNTICQNVWDSLYANSDESETPPPVPPFDTIFYHYGVNAFGCTETTITYLHVNANTDTTIRHEIVENQADTFTFLGHHFFCDTTLDILLTNLNGCDSTIHYHLHVWPNLRDTIRYTICDNQSYVWQYKSDTLYRSATFDSVKQAGPHGEDSIHYLSLNVAPTYFSRIDTAVCSPDSVYFGGRHYLTPGVYTDSLHTQSEPACDSVIQLALSVYHPQMTDTVVTACDSFAWQNRTYVFNSARRSVVITDRSSQFTITALIHDSQFSIGGNRPNWLQVQAGDSAIMIYDTLHQRLTSLRWHPSDTAIAIFDTVSGRYATIHGCDSSLALQLTLYSSDSVLSFNTICENTWLAGYQWRNVVYTDDTLPPFDTLLTQYAFTSHHCRQTIQLKLHVNSNVDTTIYHDIVENQADTFSFLGHRLFCDTTLDINLQNLNGCDSTIHYHLHVWPNLRDTLYDVFCENQSYEWMDSIYRTATFDSRSFYGTHGEDSIKYLSLRTAPSYYLQFDTAVCSPDSVLFDNRYYHASGIYIDSLRTQHPSACDSIRQLNLLVHPAAIIDTLATACDFFLWHGRMYAVDSSDTAITIIDTLGGTYTTAHGCDSALVLHLSLSATTYGEYFDTCVEDSLPRQFHHLVSYGPVGDTLVTLSSGNVRQCDSVITYHLHVWSNSFDTLYDTLCTNNLATYEWHGLHPNPQFSDYRLQTTAHDTLRFSELDSNNASAVHTLFLTIYPATSDTLYDTVCANEPYIFCDSVITSPGFHTIHFTTAHGCDSIMQLYLQWNPTYDSAYFDTINLGDSSLFDGRYYYEDGIYPIRYPTSQGCDSVRTLHLTVIGPGFVEEYDTICDGDTCLWRSQKYTLAGTYTQAVHRTQQYFSRDTTFVLHLTVIPLPTVSIDTISSCFEAPHFLLSARTDVPYLQWASSPEDSHLDGFENDSVVFASPRSTTTYFLFADYRDIPLCPVTDSIILNPILPVSANIITTPDMITMERRDVHAYNATDQFVTHHNWSIGYDANLPLYDTAASLNLSVPIDVFDVRLILQVRNEFCADTDTAFVKVLNSAIYFPNVFTPDRLDNNLFVVKGVGISNFEIWIYDRRGDFMHYSNDMDNCWDGTSHGIKCQQGTYTYKCTYVDALCPGGKQSKVGTITLLR